MRRCILFSLASLLLVLVLPTALWYAAASEDPSPADVPTVFQPEESAGGGTREAGSARAGAVPPVRADSRATLTLLRNGEVVPMTLEEYLPGTVAGEMPAGFETEALRAQAVAGRTYALYRTGRANPRHPEADLCDDPACCQAWLDESELRGRWGADYDVWHEKIRAAAADTDGMVLLFDGEPILACFHASSAGQTENVAAIWGSPLPYLVSVDSPETAGDVPNYVTTVEVSAGELRDTMAGTFPHADFSGSPESWVGETVRDPSGRVAMMRLCGQAVTGTQLRSLFGLRSAAFTLAWTGSGFLFTVTGSGHGAGMSQYGANVMARQGSGYREILLHYYPGAELSASV